MDLLRKAFRDIAAGRTAGVVLSKPCFIRHLSYADQIDMDAKRQEFFDEAKREGWQTEEERLVVLRKQGLWDDAKETELSRAKQQVLDLEEGKRKNQNLYPSMVASLVKQIAEAQKDYEAKEMERRRLLDRTCELYADRCVNDHYIVSNLFADAALSQPFFGEGDFDYLRDENVAQIARDYNSSQEGCSDYNLRKLAMQPFFQRYFGLIGENLHQFFGKPICALTFYQVDLLRYGAHFRHIYSSHDVAAFPKKVLEDPDLLTEYASAATKGKENLEKQGANTDDTVVMGLKKEDAKAMGVTQQPNVMSEIMKHGGNVTEWLSKKRR